MQKKKEGRYNTVGLIITARNGDRVYYSVKWSHRDTGFFF